MQYNFEWDPAKAQSNIEKHGVTFEQAAEVFKDPLALTLYDEDSASDKEERWITLGQANGQHHLVVVHTYRNQHDDAVALRLISARPATKREVKQYQG